LLLLLVGIAVGAELVEEADEGAGVTICPGREVEVAVPAEVETTWAA
jgi:hypothetical protein